MTRCTSELHVVEATDQVQLAAWEVQLRKAAAAAAARPAVSFEEEEAALARRPLPGSQASNDETMFYRLGVCNVGEHGIEYHGAQSAAAPPKLKRRATLCVPSVRASLQVILPLPCG